MIATPTFQRTRPILAVLGKTGGVPTKDRRLAKAVGQAVADSGCILLTGGEAGDPDSVKGQAIAGSLLSNPCPGSRIGIVPDKNSFGWHPCMGSGSNSLDLHVTWGPEKTSYKRNYLTAGLADAVIALPGSKGTPVELAFAKAFGRPIIFLDSWDRLRVGYEENEADIIQQIVGAYTTAKGLLPFTQSEVLQVASQLFPSFPTPIPEEICVVHNPAMAVREACFQLSRLSHLPGVFLGVPGHPDLTTEFGGHLITLHGGA